MEMTVMLCAMINIYLDGLGCINAAVVVLTFILLAGISFLKK